MKFSCSLSHLDRVLVTGSTGFVGRALSEFIGASVVKTIQRSGSSVCGSVCGKFDIKSDTYYGDFLDGVDVIIHCASIVHQQSSAINVSLDDYREVNTLGTLNLAKQAAEAGVSRFVFLSSVLVHGNASVDGQMFTEDDVLCPQTPFALSKAEAETGLMKVASRTGMEVVIIRCPLVYGRAPKANMALLFRMARSNLPLPLGRILNKRSFIGIDNLVHFIAICASHTKAANQIFIVGDGADFSTTRFLKMVIRACGSSTFLFVFPSSFLMALATALRQRKRASSFLGSFQVDISKAREMLNWEPPVSVEEGLRRCFVSKKC